MILLLFPRKSFGPGGGAKKNLKKYPPAGTSTRIWFPSAIGLLNAGILPHKAPGRSIWGPRTSSLNQETQRGPEIHG